MSGDRTTARTVGVLFIVATAAAIAGGTLLSPAVEDNYLTDAAGAADRVVAGALLEVIQTIAVVGIAVLLFPILKRHSEGMALGYVGARAFEGVFVLVASLSALLALTLSRDFGGSGAAVEPLGAMLVASRQWAYWIGPMLWFCVSALILGAMLYRAKLVPAWLALWGVVGAALLLVRTIFEMFGQEFSGVMQGLFAGPIAVNEMVLAVWLIVKGFSTTEPLAASVEEPAVVGAGRK